jgi:hypothetical protein
MSLRDRRAADRYKFPEPGLRMKPSSSVPLSVDHFSDPGTRLQRPLKWPSESGDESPRSTQAGIWSAPAEGGTSNDGALDQPIPAMNLSASNATATRYRQSKAVSAPLRGLATALHTSALLELDAVRKGSWQTNGRVHRKIWRNTESLGLFVASFVASFVEKGREAERGIDKAQNKARDKETRNDP